MVTIRVVSESTGKPVEGKKVTVFFDGLLRGWVEGFTNARGEVDLEADPGSGKVVVGGKTVLRGPIRGRVTVYC